MPETILVANAGSSIIKFQLFDIVDGTGGDTSGLRAGCEWKKGMKEAPIC